MNLHLDRSSSVDSTRHKPCQGHLPHFLREIAASPSRKVKHVWLFATPIMRTSVGLTEWVMVVIQVIAELAKGCFRPVESVPPTAA